MKTILISLSLVLSFSSLASEISKCRTFQSPMDYDMAQVYQYDQTDRSIYYKILFDTGLQVSRWNKDIEGTVRMMLLEDGTAHVHYLERLYRTYTNDWGYEQRDILRTTVYERIETSWTYDQEKQMIEIEGIGYGYSAICSSPNPGLEFTYTRDFKNLKLDQNGERFLYLGGATYDILRR